MPLSIMWGQLHLCEWHTVLRSGQMGIARNWDHRRGGLCMWMSFSAETCKNMRKCIVSIRPRKLEILGFFFLLIYAMRNWRGVSRKAGRAFSVDPNSEPDFWEYLSPAPWTITPHRPLLALRTSFSTCPISQTHGTDCQPLPEGTLIPQDIFVFVHAPFLSSRLLNSTQSLKLTWCHLLLEAIFPPSQQVETGPVISPFSSFRAQHLSCHPVEPVPASHSYWIIRSIVKIVSFAYTLTHITDYWHKRGQGKWFSW